MRISDWSSDVCSSDLQLASISAPSGDLDVAPVPVELERPHARMAGKIKISPLAARIAAAKNIEISDIVGSGPAGRIRKSDLGLPVAALAPPPVEERSPILTTPAADIEPDPKSSGEGKRVEVRVKP